MSQAQAEAVLEPELPIIDPHHHLWDRGWIFAGTPPVDHPFDRVGRKTPRYLLDDLLADLGDGHNVLATVYVQCGSMLRADGPEAFKPVGETEFVNGAAAMCASGAYGPVRACAGIVGHVDLTSGAATVDAVIEAHLRTAGDRFKGIRHSASWDADPGVLAREVAPGGLMGSVAFREGYARLADYGLSFDSWLLEPQLPERVDLARAFSNVPVVLDHVGTPLGIGGYAGRREERFPVWRENVRALAALPHANVKLGGLGMAFAGFPSLMQEPPASSAQLAEEWRPYIETCIEAFGPERCMFESNYPVDKGSCSYRTLWNAFKILARGHSADEKAAMFSGTARRVYRLSV